MLAAHMRRLFLPGNKDEMTRSLKVELAAYFSTNYQLGRRYLKWESQVVYHSHHNLVKTNGMY